MYSNPLFLSEHAQPATQLNKLSDAAPVADSTAEAPAATAESATTPQTNQIADCVPVAESASRPDSEQAADHGSVAEAASQLHSDLALTADAASQLHTEQDAEETSATDAASQLQSEQDAEHASASQSLQDQQDTDRAAAASSASTSGRIEDGSTALCNVCARQETDTDCAKAGLVLSQAQIKLCLPEVWPHQQRLPHQHVVA